MNQDTTNEQLNQLLRENALLREKIEKLELTKKDIKKTRRFRLSKRAGFAFLGRGLKRSLRKLYDELPNNVSKDTIADVSAHLIWRFTRIGVFTILFAVLPALIFCIQTVILRQQNKMFEAQNKLFKMQITQVNKQNELITGQNTLFSEQNDLVKQQNRKVDIQNDLVKGQNQLVQNQNGLFENQNDLVAKQNIRVEQQTELIEAGRRSSLVFLMGNIMDKVDEELKLSKDRKLSYELVGRITALSQSLKPYRFLKNDKLIRKPLSPERGQLLLALVNSRLDTMETYDLIFDNTKFSRADLDEAYMEGAYLVGARLKNANMEETMLTKANMSGADLHSADLTESNLVKANFTYADLTEARLVQSNLKKAILKRTDLSGANLTKANLKGALLEGTIMKNAILKGADLSDTDLTSVNFKNANLTKVDLDNAVVLHQNWFNDLEEWKVKGLAQIKAKYIVQEARVEDEFGSTYFVVKKK